MRVEKMAESGIDPEAVSRITRVVPIPFAFLFFTDVGQYTGEFAQSRIDFFDKLNKASLESIEFHFARGDFGTWIRNVLGDEYLAKRINKIDRSIRGEKLRTTIQDIVKKRLDLLKEAKMPE